MKPMKSDESKKSEEMEQKENEIELTEQELEDIVAGGPGCIPGPNRTCPPWG